MKFFFLMVMLGLMSSGGGQRTVPAAPGSILKRTVDFHERLTPDLDANESKTLSKRSDGSYATHYPRPEYVHVQRFYPIAGSTMLIGYPLIKERGGINGHGGYGRVIPIHGRYNYRR